MKIPRYYPFVLLVKLGCGEGNAFRSGEGRGMKVEQGKILSRFPTA
jgi:hypothetical protein